MARLTYTRIYANDTGRSHMDEASIELLTTDYAPPAVPSEVSEPVAVSLARFSMIPTGWEGDWHPAPRPQYFLLLAGEVEVEVGDGQVYRTGPGSIALLEDVSGKGHRTRVVGDQPMLGVFLELL